MFVNKQTILYTSQDPLRNKAIDSLRTSQAPQQNKLKWQAITFLCSSINTNYEGKSKQAQVLSVDYNYFFKLEDTWLSSISGHGSTSKGLVQNCYLSVYRARYFKIPYLQQRCSYSRGCT